MNLQESPLDILERLTPARLPSYTIVCDPTCPQNPCLVPSALASSPVATGLLFLGQGRDARREIKEHYRLVAKRQRLKVVIEVKAPIPKSQRPEKAEAEDKGGDERGYEDEGRKKDDCESHERGIWRLEARWLEAQVYVWKGDVVEGNERSWELGEAIKGSYDVGDRELKIEDMSLSGGKTGEVGEEAEMGNLLLDGDSEWAQPGVFGRGGDIDASAVEW
jgi:hypothetical protein